MPTDEEVHRIHARYLEEVVEELGLCPFARRSREQGRVHRPLFRVDAASPTARDVAEGVATCARTHADAEIILVTFIDEEGRYDEPTAFDVFVTAVREAYEALNAPLYFMVPFHPRLDETIDASRPLTKDTLVPLIRRTPDPVIQCVNGAVLEHARAQAQQAAFRKLLEAHGDDPVLRSMLERSVQTDSELSADIARANFAACGDGAGRDELERRIQALIEARRGTP
ncbi:MAG: DUF1415 family protein [Nannocystaceae bacterium]|nr:DUF1415 family protein [bacterium]